VSRGCADVPAAHTANLWSTLAAISAGGAIGALGRYGLSVLWPSPSQALPWTTVVVNVSGCLLIGVLMSVIAAKSLPHWVRPLLGVGVLGGYTTFSTYTVDIVRLFAIGRAGVAVAYLLVTVAGSLAAVVVGAALMRRALRT
jgi:CrcB protein